MQITELVSKERPTGEMQPAGEMHMSSYDVEFVEEMQLITAMKLSNAILIHDLAVAITPVVSKVTPAGQMHAVHNVMKCGPPSLQNLTL